MVQNPRNRYLYERVRYFRVKGLSYNQIQKKVPTAKSNISLWCRDIKLTEPQQKNLKKARVKNQILAVKANHIKKKKEIDAVNVTAKKEIAKLSNEAFRVGGSIMYWAEGAKSNGTSISNSDPRIIELMIAWFNKFFGLTPDRLKAHLHIHYGNDDNKIKKYWSERTGIPLQNFGKSFIKPKGTGHRTNILPNGIIRIRVKGVGGENLRRRILAWSEKIFELSQRK